MSIHAELKRWYSGGMFDSLHSVLHPGTEKPQVEKGPLKPIIYGKSASGPNYIQLELTVIMPPSMENRIVYLVLDDDDVTDLLLLLRREAIENRKATLTKGQS